MAAQSTPQALPGEIWVKIPNKMGTIFGGGAILLVIGGLGLWGVYFDQNATLEGAETVFIPLISWGCFLAGLAVFLFSFNILRARWIAVLPIGVRYIDPKMPGEQWQLEWREIDSLDLQVAHVRRSNSSSSALMGRPGSVRVRLVIRAIGWDVYERFRSLRAGRNIDGPDSTSLVFGDQPKLIQPLDAALRQYGGYRYRGVIDEGQTSSPL